MAYSKKNVINVTSLQSLFYVMKTNTAELPTIIGGCTSLKELPQKYLTIRKIKELCLIEKKERYIEVGPGVTLSQLEEIDNTRLPAIICEAIKSIATPFVRNIATIGGNIFCKSFKHTLYAPLLALDTRLEIQKGSDIEHIAFSKLFEIPEGYILTKIRIPIEKWDVEIFKRTGPSHILTKNSASFVFLANTDNSQLTTIRVVYAGAFTFFSYELENKLIGSYLPLPEKSIEDALTEAASLFDKNCPEADSVTKKQFLNLFKYSLEQLT